MPVMNPKPAILGSRPARSTGEGNYNQRVDGEFYGIENKYGDVINVVYDKGVCRNPDCGAIGKIFRSDNDLNICMACMVVQNDGKPEGDGKLSNRAKKRLNDKLKYDCIHSTG